MRMSRRQSRATGFEVSPTSDAQTVDPLELRFVACRHRHVVSQSHPSARLDPRDGNVEREIQLPTHAGAVPEDINYNGFTVLESGVIVTASFGRPAGCTDQGVDAFQNCVSEDTPLPPSVVVSVDPDSLDVLDTYQLEEGVGGRLTRAVPPDSW